MILFALIISGLLWLLFNKNDENIINPIIPGVIEPTEVCDYDLEKLQAMWKENYEINDDYVGQIIFDSGLLNLPFVQGASNNTYLRTDWQTMKYDIEGSIFLDSSNKLDDMNLTIYGHYVYPEYDTERTHMFSPLEKLLEEENYEENKHLIIVLSDGIREYEVAEVYFCQLYPYEGEYVYTDDEMQYYWRNIGEDYFNYDDLSVSEEYFDNYLKLVNDSHRYDTGIKLSKDDKFVTLQTCVYNRDDLREILILKEVKRWSY